MFVSFNYISTTFDVENGFRAPKIPRMWPLSLFFDVIDLNFDHDDLDFEIENLDKNLKIEFWPFGWEQIEIGRRGFFIHVIKLFPGKFGI